MKFRHTEYAWTPNCFSTPPNVEVALRPVRLTRRLNLADIERIAPLEEGSLPYHLVEAQKQVLGVW